MRERVFITGVGVICAIGNNMAEFAEALRNGRSGAARVAAFDVSQYPSQIAFEVKGFNPARHFRHHEIRRMDRSSQLALVASREAVASSGFQPGAADPRRVGVFIGSTHAGTENATRYYTRWSNGDRSWLQLVYDISLYSMGTRVSHELDARGPNMMFSTACSSSNVAIGYAANLIRRGRLEAALTGGADCMARVPFAGFNVLRNVASETIRPFDRNRAGVILAEGAAMLMLESESLCRRRGATPMAEILGYGMSTDANHLTAPDSTGRGPALAITRALADAETEAGELSYINAHGTGTRHNDEAETRAIKRALGKIAYDIPVSSTKSMHGHALGAAGAIEAAAIIAGMRGGFAPPTINYETPDPHCDLNYVPNAAVQHRITTALSNAFGFGGNNCSAVFRSCFA